MTARLLMIRYTFLALAGAVGSLPAVVRAAEVPPLPSEMPAADAKKEARSLFAEGQLRYSLGEYDQAIAAFRRAYELSSAPGLLFNIAQAHRLNGQCRQALEIYRHFIRLSPTSEHRTEAETQVAALLPRCGAALPSAPAAPPPAPNNDVATSTIVEPRQSTAEPAPPPRWSNRRRVSAGLLVGGVGAGLAAGIVYLWNDGRYDDWRQEDQRLRAPSPGLSPDAWIAAQQQNDTLLASIERTDTVNGVIAGLSVAAVLAAAVLLLLLDR